MAKKRKKKHKVDGIEFDSKTEAVHYQILRDNKDIEIISRQKTFSLFDNFTHTKLPEFKKATHRKMVYTPDFIIKIKGVKYPIAMETKGHARKDYMIRKKLFTKFYGDRYYFYECKDNSKGDKLKKDLEVMINAQKHAGK